MKVQMLRNQWHNLNCDSRWVGKEKDMISSITYYVLEFLNYNKLIHRSNSISNSNDLDYFREMCAGKKKTGVKGIREINGDHDSLSYFESQVNKKISIKHVPFFSDANICPLDQVYQRSHQIKYSRIQKYVEKNKICLYNLEYFILLVCLMENSCVYAPRNSSKGSVKSVLENDDFELENDLLPHLTSELKLSTKLYRKIYCEKTNKTFTKQMSWPEFLLFRQDLDEISKFLIAKSFNVDLELTVKYKSLSHLYHNKQSTIDIIGKSTIPFISELSLIEKVRNICFEILS